MSKHKIYSLIVEESNKIVGFITMHDFGQMLYKALFFLLAPFFCIFSEQRLSQI